MIQFRKVTVGNLETFFDSTEYSTFTQKPISHLRVKSYVKNPRADGSENVLYMAFDKKKLIGYRTLFPSTFFLENNAHKFIWLSGNWVSPERRREGISSMLFDEIKKDWDGKIIFANYAPTSKAFYDKTGDFKVLKTLNGVRYYRRHSWAQILKDKYSLNKFLYGILRVQDNLLNIVFDMRFGLFGRSNLQNKQFQVIRELDTDTIAFVEQFRTLELFRRGKKEFDWILNWPWIETDEESKSMDEQYHFSVYANMFSSKLYKVMDNRGHKIVAVVMVKIRDGKLEMPYSYVDHEGAENVAKLLSRLSDEQSINHLTIFNPKVNEKLDGIRALSLFKKTFHQSFYTSTQLQEKYPQMRDHEIQNGDGDGVFT